MRDTMNYKELEKKYEDMDDERWEKLSDEEKKECDRYIFEKFMRTSHHSPVRDEWKKEELEEFVYVPPEENTYEDP